LTIFSRYRFGIGLGVTMKSHRVTDIKYGTAIGYDLSEWLQLSTLQSILLPPKSEENQCTKLSNR